MKKKKEIVSTMPAAPPLATPPCNHTGQPVAVGQFTILAGGTRYLQPQDLAKADFIVPLEPRIPAAIGQRVSILACPWQDFGPPPPGFEHFLRNTVIPELEAGKKILVYCIGSHGRTGTFLASLVALLEPETLDPIAAVRTRHCHHAVETRQQAEFVFTLRGQKLPSQYEEEFKPAPVQQPYNFKIK